MPSFVDLNAQNIGEHHLCCALSDSKHETGVERKKQWLKRRFKEGLVFRKLDVRGKVFVEYARGEAAWRPIVAPGWFVIHCLWVSGQYAKRGHGRALVESCLADARREGKAGVVVAAAKRKRPFLSDPKFFSHLGFDVVDTAGEFILLAREVRKATTTPRFADSVKRRGPRTGGSFVAQHTDQCPFNTHWAEEMAEAVRKRGYHVEVERITTRKRAQRVASPLGTFGLARDGELVTHHLNTENATHRLLDKLERSKG
ncbi:MAG: GNAT family N-acetyltransferase [Myxococcota bacterium]